MRVLFSPVWQGTHPKAPLTPKEVAVQLGISTRTLQKLKNSGDIASVSHRGRVYYTQNDVDVYVNSHFYKGNNKKSVA